MQSCVDSNACTVDHVLLHNELKAKTRCDACKVIVKDVENELMWYAKPGKAVIASVIDSVCEKLKFRHRTSSFLEDTCDDLIDELQVRVWRCS